MKSLAFYVLMLSAFGGITGTITTFFQPPAGSVRNTCNPNGCVENVQLCDGVNDCTDGCDENAELCKWVKACALPSSTDEDKSYVINCDKNATPIPGKYVAEMSLLSFACKPGYMLDNGKERFQSFCLNRSWTPSIPSCSIRTCSKPSVPNIKFKYYFNQTEVGYEDKYAIGTRLRTSCLLSFHRPNHEEISCNEYGEWNIKDIKCVPDCGRYSDEAKLLYKNNYFPWHVLVHAYYNSTNWHNFSGTLIAPDLVLTDLKGLTHTDNITYSTDKVEVIVNGCLDQPYQKSYKVKEIIISPKRFFHKLKFYEETENIALLQLVNKVEISATVRPACVDWMGVKLLPEKLPSSGKMVLIKRKLQPQRYETRISHTDEYSLEKCASKLENEILPGYDLFCGQFTDENVFFTDNDWGTGYFVENPSDDLFYIKGVLVNNYPKQKIRVFTNVASHIDWIKAVYEKYYEIEKPGQKNSNHTVPFLQHDSQDYSYHTAHLPFYYESWEFSCNGTELKVKPTFACYIPTNDETYVTYKIQCPFTTSNGPNIDCMDTSKDTFVPENSVLTSNCEKGNVSISKPIETAVCLGGHWFPKLRPAKKWCGKLSWQAGQLR